LATLVSVVAAGALITQMLRPEPVQQAPIVKRAKPAARKAKSRSAKITPKSRAKANGLAREHA
jgi:hypothetical protein